MCVTLLHTKAGVAKRFINDVREATAEIMKSPKAKAGGQVSWYNFIYQFFVNECSNKIKIRIWLKNIIC